MNTLSRELRRQLERTVRDARAEAENGAQKALKGLGVGEAKVPSGLSADDASQRNALRAHGRQLGDVLDSATGKQRTAHLRAEVAYQHWHRMLFARFLAENALLIEPQSQIAITLDECRELARDLGEDWLALASRYAQSMLPQIFRSGDPALDLAMPPETRSKLEDLMKALPSEVFTAADSLGWVYQYWQADKKDAVNRSETKIGADELPAVTQLFTEDYMVWFLLHNTLGAWWAGRVLAANPKLAQSAKDEDELRAACRVGDIEWTYLRFVHEEGQPWRPAAGTFEGWPEAAKDIRVLDPCMGSGHFLVFALPILAAMRAQEEQLAPEAAVEAVLRDNLFGLEIDPRCTQIAAFNLALAAWRRVGFRPLPSLHLACSGLSLGVSKTEWLKLAERAALALPVPPESDLLGSKPNLFSEPVQRGFDALHDLFARAPTLGSLIDPATAGGDLLTRGFKDLEPLLAKVLQEADTGELSEMAVAAQGLAKAAELLAGGFTLAATNVPFLTQIKFSQPLDTFISEYFPSAKANLASTMILRMTKLVAAGGSLAFVAPQSWWFLKRYTSFRRDLLAGSTLDGLVRLGEGAFESPQAGGELVGLSILSMMHPENLHRTFSVDVSELSGTKAKAVAMVMQEITSLTQSSQLTNTNAIIRFSPQDDHLTLEHSCTALFGSSAGDRSHFVRYFWEVLMRPTGVWEFHQTTPSTTQPFSGRTEVILWENERGQMYDLAERVRHLNHKAQQWRSGKPNWGKHGVVVSLMAPFPAALYSGEIYDTNCCAIVPGDISKLPALWALCSSPKFAGLVRELNQNRKVEVRTLLQVPFDLARWKREALDNYPDGLPTGISSDATQWLFSGHPKRSDNTLQVAVARLLGYRWPRQEGSCFQDCPAVGLDGLETHADRDGIVALDPVQGEQPAAPRLRELLAVAFGKDWSAGKLATLLTDAGCAGKTLDDWLRDAFFEQHCALFHERPFVWHVWDGRRDGFHALVNYHKLAAPNGEGKRTLEKLIYSYLGDWIDRQRADQKSGVEGADGRLAAAEHLKAELEKILAGEPPYDLFVRWKPLAEQPIGWEPDINDGVRMNIRPFMTARPYGARAGNACILRKTPNIKWTKDRGKEPERDKDDFPWFWSWDEETVDFAGGKTFDGNRWNDLHYSVAFKQAARAKRSP